MKYGFNKQIRGFSLIEMMVVLTVVSILLAFAAPNLFSLISSNTLSGEGTVIQNQLTLAQQMAVSKSADVEVRFFKMKDESAALTEEAFRAFQLFQYSAEGEMLPVSNFFRIRNPVAVHENLSTLVQPAATGGISSETRYGFDSPRIGSELVPTGRSGTKVDTPYVAFRFRPDGSTDLPYRSGDARDTWYITLVQGEGALQNDEPDNFVCLQVNPYNGKINVFRP
ncbi:MAG: hypothetical protein CMO61_13125 [Verrucomicrobiales bacterium]|jgi:uncharacterized protein (TIGR02596 family)|nr:hypothetical protein [Verrucomicrobiales bacterium]|tara:strand:- start:1556 stop:2230 length:675 start_codon:yes stop_codon:yes gene_type:complete